MAVSKAQARAKAKYTAKHYDTITFTVKKGRKDFYKQAAELRGVGFQEMIRTGIDEYIANHPVESESNCAIVSATK